MRAAENTQTDDIDIFLQGGFGDHLGRLADAGVDHFKASVAQGTRHHFGPTIMAIQAGLGDENADLFLAHGGSFWVIHEVTRRGTKKGSILVCIRG